MTQDIHKTILQPAVQALMHAGRPCSRVCKSLPSRRMDNAIGCMEHSVQQRPPIVEAKTLYINDLSNKPAFLGMQACWINHYNSIG